MDLINEADILPPHVTTPTIFALSLPPLAAIPDGGVESRSGDAALTDRARAAAFLEVVLQAMLVEDVRAGLENAQLLAGDVVLHAHRARAERGAVHQLRARGGWQVRKIGR